MTEATIEIPRKTLKKLLKMHSDATQLLENIPEKQDQGRLSEVSQHIGAELEARITKMTEIENQNPPVKNILDEIQNNQVKKPETLEELEKQVLD